MASKYKQVCGYGGHPMAYSNGVILEHRLVMSEILGRNLRPGELVHHKDTNPFNNDPSNLELSSRSKHPSIHAKGPTMIRLICAYCGEPFDKELRNFKAKSKLGQTNFYCNRTCMGKSVYGNARKISNQ